MNTEGGITEIDVNFVRTPDIALNGLKCADNAYTFYYDETNNDRRLHVTEDGFNVKDPKCFVLGGVVHRGAPRPLDIAALRASVRLQPNAPELKLAHLGKGTILDLLGLKKVETFLDWLIAEDLFVHYSAIDPIYWSVVDIIDSILANDRMAPMHVYDRKLKADLFTILATDFDDVAAIFHKYSYPNVGEANRTAFIDDLLQRLEHREDRLEHFDFYMLKGVLQAGKGDDPLLFLEDERPNTLIDSFVMFFVHRFCLFKNAHHILDVEPEIELRLRAFRLWDESRELKNYRFADSKHEPGVQVSDAVAGLLGKLFTYVTRTEAEQVVHDRKNLTANQARTLGKLNLLLDRSQNETSAFLHQIASLESMQIGQYFLEGL